MRNTTIVAFLALSCEAVSAAVPTPPRRITDPQSLNSPTVANAAPVPLDDLSVVRGIVDAAWSIDGRKVFLVTNLTGRYNLWSVDASGGWPRQLIQSDDVQVDLAPSPDGKVLVYAQDSGGNEYYDLYVIPIDGGERRRITATPDISEFSPHWSPDGSRLAALVRPKSGTSDNIALIDPASGKVRELTSERIANFNWAIVRWTPDGKSIIANRENVASTRSSVWLINAATGKAEQLTPDAEDLTFATDISADGRTLGISSNANTGQLHAGLFDITTRKFRWLKPTPWEQVSGTMSADGRTLAVATSVDGRKAVSLVDISSTVERQLDFAPGYTEELTSRTRGFSPTQSWILLFHSGADAQGEAYIFDTATNAVRRLTNLAMASLDAAPLPQSQIVTYTSFDGTLVSAIVTMPPNLKRDGHNPAIVLPHGGPTGQASDAFSRTKTAFASRGYILIEPNFRGSTGYGKAFQEANIKDLGGADLKDVLAAKDFLVASGYVDPNKVGITGGSYGGFMTLMAVSRAPDAFAAAVQEYGIIDWNTMYETSDASLREYIRALVGDPGKDKALYAAQSPLTYLKAAHAPLLSLQGENDVRVPRDQAQQIDAQLKAQGVTVETIFYPGEGHGFYKRENQSDSLLRKITWFDKYLKGSR